VAVTAAQKIGGSGGSPAPCSDTRQKGGVGCRTTSSSGEKTCEGERGTAVVVHSTLLYSAGRGRGGVISVAPRGRRMEGGIGPQAASTVGVWRGCGTPR
jgi:hypothetical protein